MEPKYHLVVPEVNEQALFEHRGIVANPNCSTIQMMVALEPIRRKFGLEQIIVSTYQQLQEQAKTAFDEMLSEAKELFEWGKKWKVRSFQSRVIRSIIRWLFNLVAPDRCL